MVKAGMVHVRTKAPHHLSDWGWNLKEKEKEFKNRLCYAGDGGHVGREKERLEDVQRSEGWLECSCMEKKGQRNRSWEP